MVLNRSKSRESTMIHNDVNDIAYSKCYLHQLLIFDYTGI